MLNYIPRRKKRFLVHQINQLSFFNIPMKALALFIIYFSKDSQISLEEMKLVTDVTSKKFKSGKHVTNNIFVHLWSFLLKHNGHDSSQ